MVEGFPWMNKPTKVHFLLANYLLRNGKEPTITLGTARQRAGLLGVTKKQFPDIQKELVKTGLLTSSRGIIKKRGWWG
jgi:hypothetical protein